MMIIILELYVRCDMPHTHTYKNRTLNFSAISQHIYICLAVDIFVHFIYDGFSVAPFH